VADPGEALDVARHRDIVPVRRATAHHPARVSLPHPAGGHDRRAR
jgi:hypothetical protein